MYCAGKSEGTVTLDIMVHHFDGKQCMWTAILSSIYSMSTIHNNPQNFPVFSCATLQVHSFLCKEETKTCYVYENATDAQICLSVHDTAEAAALDTLRPYKLCMYLYVRSILGLRSQPTILYWL